MPRESAMEPTAGIRDEQTHAVIGAAMTVHRELGCGFLEPVYQEAMAIELTASAVPFEREPLLPIYYRGEKLHLAYRADFLCFGSIIVELKALLKLSTNENAQLLNYLKASGLHRGLILNFGSPSLEIRRLVL
jgi:GxxExxY protein